LFATVVVVRRPITRPDIEVMRRSLAMASHLSNEQTRWILDEADRLLDERARIDAVVARLAPPWADVRVVLNELHRLTGATARTTADRRSGPPPRG
jgi:hypothetical protein